MVVRPNGATPTAFAGHAFRDADLLAQALTHRSAGSPHNERLEFLGDALVSQFVAEALYVRWPKADEGALTRLEISVRVTDGSESAPVFRRVVARLAELIPRATGETFEGAAHVPQVTSPERYVEITRRALLQHATA